MFSQFDRDAMARALELLGAGEAASRLDAVMAGAVARQRRLRGQPLGGAA